MLALFSFLSLILFLIGSLPFITKVAKGRANPHKASIVIYLLLNIVGVLSQFASGATFSLVFPLFAVLLNIAILMVMQNSTIGAINKFDKISFVLIFLILIIWWATNSPAIAIVLLTVVNLISKILTANKLYQHPFSEPMFSYIFWMSGSIFTILAVGSINWILILPALHNFITLGIIVGITMTRRKNSAFV